MGAEQAVRVLRCTVFATTTTVLAALAHLASGTVLPPAGWLIAAGAGVGVAVHPLTRRERGLPTVLGAAVAGQLVLHAVLTVAMVRSCGHLSTGAPAMPGMASTSVPAARAAGPVARAAVVHHAVAGMGCSTGGWLPMSAPGRPAAVMVAGHLLAAVLLAWWLRRGERALGRLGVVVVRALAPLVRRLVGVLVPPHAPLQPVGRSFGWGATRAPHPGLRGAQGLTRRGPPVAVAA